MSKTTHNFLSIINDRYTIPWSMTRAEQAMLIQILQDKKPKVAIEIGTYNGGSLQVLSDFSEKVYAIDITPSYRDKKCDNFSNVEYLIGDSKAIVPDLITRLNASNEIVEFVLIDGDHSSKGVLEDITNILKLIPKKPILIILHDSFNPNCRQGMKAYDYNANKHVETVELDFVTGAYNHDGLYREMWGGFAAITMSPNTRSTNLKITEYQDKLYKITYYKSIHFYKKLFWFARPIYKLFKK